MRERYIKRGLRVETEKKERFGARDSGGPWIVSYDYEPHVMSHSMLYIVVTYSKLINFTALIN